MIFSNGLVFANGILFIGFGLGFMIAPACFSALFTGAQLTTASAIIDVRATYGGMALGLGIWLVVCARQDIRLGLIGAFAVLTSIVLTRLVGIVLDGGANGFMYAFLAAEVLFLLATGYAWRSNKC